MAENQLVVSLALKASGYKAEIQNVNKETKKLRSEFELAKSKSEDFENSLEGQKAKLKLISGEYDNAKKKLDIYTAELNKNKKAVEDSIQAYKNQEKEVEKLSNELTNAKNTFGDASKEVKELQKSLSAAEKQLETKRKAVVSTDSSLKNMQITVNNTEKECNDLKRELEKSEKAIEEFGKEAIDSSSDVKKFENNIEKSGDKSVAFGAHLTQVADGMSDLGDKASEAGKAVLGMLGELVDAGAEHAASVAGTEFLLKNLSGTTQEWIRTNALNAEALGLTEKQFKELGVSVGGYAENLGLTGDEAILFTDKVIGLSTDLAALLDIPVKDALGDVKSALMGNYESMDKYNVSLSASQLENSEYVKGLGKTWNELTDTEKAQAALNEMLKQGASSKGLAAQEADEYGSKMRLLKEKIEETVGVIGEKLLPILEPIVEKTLDVVKAISDWVQENPGTVKAILVFAASIGTALTVAGELIKIIGIIAGIIAAVAAGFISASVAIGVAVVAAIAGLVVAIVAYWDEIKGFFVWCWQGIVDWWNENIVPWIEEIKVKWQEFKEWLGELWESTKQFFMEKWQGIVDWYNENIQPWLDLIKEKWQEFKDWIGELWESTKQFFIDKWQEMMDFYNEYVQPWIDIFTKLWEIAGVLIGLAIQYIKDWFIQKWTELKAWYDETIQPWIDLIGQKWEEFKTKVSEAMTKIKDWFIEKWNELKAWYTETIQPWIDLIGQKWEEFKTRVQQTWDKVKNAFTDAWDSVKRWYNDNIQPWIDLIEQGWSDLCTAISDFCQSIKDSIKEAFSWATQKATDGVNSIIGMLNKIPGVDIAPLSLEVQEPDMPVARAYSARAYSMEPLAVAADTPVAMSGSYYSPDTTKSRALNSTYNKVSNVMGSMRSSNVNSTGFSQETIMQQMANAIIEGLKNTEININAINNLDLDSLGRAVTPTVERTIGRKQQNRMMARGGL